MLTQADIDYIISNEGADVTRLLLGAKSGKSPKGKESKMGTAKANTYKTSDADVMAINYPLCAKCIQAREKIKIKAPLWYNNPSLMYPFAVSVEQGSSQATALFKQKIIAQLLNVPETPGFPDKTQSQNENVLESPEFPDKPQSQNENVPETPEIPDKKDANEGNLSGRKIITADLTGGMGIDSYFISKIASTHYYFERNAELCAATEYNFNQLGANNIIVSNRDVTADNCAALQELQGKDITLIYIDPARRTQTGGKAIMLQDYEPNIIELQDLLFATSRYILVKVSPMADIKQNLQLLPKTSAVYIVAVNNECKELLFLLDSQHPTGQEPPIYCCDVILICNSLTNNNIENSTNQGAKTAHPDYQLITNLDNVTIKEEEQAQPKYTSTVGEYLYEPGKAILKSGAYKLLSQRYNCSKLAVSTHLYTSNEINGNFPGKIFKVEECIPFNKKTLKEIAAKHPYADITARNFPLDTNALKKLSGIKDGGCKHIFAVTLTNGEKVLIITHKL